MQPVVFLIMRRMRAPLLLLILAYSVAILGMVLIPGETPTGEPYHMGFLHAFYFVSYMATTIGFGEIPHAFTDLQRAWVLVSIYLTVIIWIYSIGSLIALAQDKALRRVIAENQFRRQIRALREPFVLICGYGETGQALTRTLLANNQHAVVLDRDARRVDDLKLSELPEQVPAVVSDAHNPELLQMAGLLSPYCHAVVALTNSNEVNLKIAISAKLLRKEIQVICRADSPEVEANMASFGTDRIIDPFDSFALHLATAFQSPCLILLQDWLTGQFGDDRDPVSLPRKGHWILCGYGRFGKKVFSRLQHEELEVTVIEATPERTGWPPEADLVKGWGTDAATLRHAGVERAVGLVAGTDNDVNNLSIVMTARDLNPKLFVVVRQNLRSNQVIFDALRAEMVMHPSHIVAGKIRTLLTTPLLDLFFGLCQYQNDTWACDLFKRIADLLTPREDPHVWQLTLSTEDALAIHSLLERGEVVKLGHLCCDPADRELPLSVIPLLLVRRNGERALLPEGSLHLHRGDGLLFCGSNRAKSRMRWTLRNENALRYVLTGRVPYEGWVWRMIRRRYGHAD